MGRACETFIRQSKSLTTFCSIFLCLSRGEELEKNQFLFSQMFIDSLSTHKTTTKISRFQQTKKNTDEGKKLRLIYWSLAWESW